MSTHHHRDSTLINILSHLASFIPLPPPLFLLAFFNENHEKTSPWCILLWLSGNQGTSWIIVLSHLTQRTGLWHHPAPTMLTFTEREMSFSVFPFILQKNLYIDCIFFKNIKIFGGREKQGEITWTSCQDGKTAKVWSFVQNRERDES